MTHIPNEAIPDFEVGIYLPMLLIIVNHDIDSIKQGNFKLKEPYLQLLLGVKAKIEQDLSETKIRFKREKMKLRRGAKDNLFTEYYFYFDQMIELRRYSNIRLRNHSEYLFGRYLNGQSLKS